MAPATKRPIQYVCARAQTQQRQHFFHHHWSVLSDSFRLGNEIDCFHFSLIAGYTLIYAHSMYTH
jgi:hypothetical protein